MVLLDVGMVKMMIRRILHENSCENKFNINEIVLQDPRACYSETIGKR
jgi:hypothetical protein